MTAQDVITRARLQLNDSIAPFRWPDSELLLWVDDGQRNIALRRPDSMYSNGIVVSPPFAVTSVTQVLQIGEEFLPAMMEYVTYSALMKDAEHAANTNLAAQHLSMYSAYVQGA